MLGTPSSADVLLWILCAVVVGAAARKVWPFVRQFVHVVDLLSELPTRLDTIEGRLNDQDEKLDLIGERFNDQDKELAAIKHEVQNNDGSSLKDTADRTEALARQTSKLLDEHIEWSKTDTEQVSARFNRIESKLADDVDQN